MIKNIIRTEKVRIKERVFLNLVFYLNDSKRYIVEEDLDCVGEIVTSSDKYSFDYEFNNSLIYFVNESGYHYLKYTVKIDNVNTISFCNLTLNISQKNRTKQVQV